MHLRYRVRAHEHNVPTILIEQNACLLQKRMATYEVLVTTLTLCTSNAEAVQRF